MAAIEMERTNKIHIYSMQVHSKVNNRFARTLVTSKVRNEKTNPEETTFSVILPENAYISEFEMEINGKVYKAYVKEKEEAKDIYQQAVSEGKSAGHVELKARDSEKFTVSVNVEPQSETIFRLVYEELLQRRNGKYELVINIHPGQTVEHLEVEVIVDESRPLTFIKTPSLRSGKDILKDDKNLDPPAVIDIISNNYATVKFNPDIDQQMKFGKNLGGDQNLGLAGQFIVQYDVERDPQGGEVLIREGYFVHFFAPSELETLPKHIVFVLDHSGSMGGRKIEQLTESMENILSELNNDDLFSIVLFSYEASVWNVEKNAFFKVDLNSGMPVHRSTDQYVNKDNLPEPAKVTKENIKKAKKAVKTTFEGGSTNMMDGLQVGLFLTKRTQEKMPGNYQPMIVCLTDGIPDHGTESILKAAEDQNSGTNRTAIFSLSFGEDADKYFLKKLSVENLGFSRHIYEASDASLQLQEFYSLISSPLLNNVAFKYVDEVTEVTDTNCPIFFQGSEFVVAGKIGANFHSLCDVNAMSTQGSVTLNPERKESAVSLERLWAYLTIKQLLDKAETQSNSSELKKKALDLALKYSFVTSVSSLVVVKPEETQAIGTERADIEFDPLAYLNQYQGSGISNFMASGLQPHCLRRSSRIDVANQRAHTLLMMEDCCATMDTKKALKYSARTRLSRLLCCGFRERTSPLDDIWSTDLDNPEAHECDYIRYTDDSTFYTKFRLRKETCLNILSHIEEKITISTNVNNMTPMNQLLTTLKFYGSDGNINSLADEMDIEVATALEIVKTVSKILAQLHPEHVKMPEKDDIQKIQEKFYQFASFPKVIGIISVTHIPIHPSVDDDEEIYKNQKGNFSIKCQIVCDADMKILDVFTQSPGSETDDIIFNKSQIKIKFENGNFPDSVLLGGQGFRTRNYLLTPIRDAVTIEQQRYNDSHSKSLTVIEKFFELWKKRFPILVYGSDISAEEMRNVILATAVLHNMALNMDDGEAPPAENIIQDEFENLIKENKISEVVKSDEHAEDVVRNQFVNNYFFK